MADIFTLTGGAPPPALRHICARVHVLRDRYFPRLCVKRKKRGEPRKTISLCFSIYAIERALMKCLQGYDARLGQEGIELQSSPLAFISSGVQ